MRYFIVLGMLLAGVFAVSAAPSSAQMGMMGYGEKTDGHTAKEEAEGKEIWEKLQAKQITCAQLSEGDFEALGEYYMGRMMGSSHEAMNEMIERRLGKEGEEEMHAAMGKQMSGCDMTAAYPAGSGDFMSMMHSGSFGGFGHFGGWGMMGYGPSYSFGHAGWFGGLLMLVVWVLLIVGFVASVKWLLAQTRSGDKKDYTHRQP